MNYPLFIFVTTLFFGITSTQTQANNNSDGNKVKKVFDFFSDHSDQDYKSVKFSELSNFQYDPSQVLQDDYPHWRIPADYSKAI